MYDYDYNDSGPPSFRRSFIPTQFHSDEVLFYKPSFVARSTDSKRRNMLLRHGRLRMYVPVQEQIQVPMQCFVLFMHSSLLQRRLSMPRQSNLLRGQLREELLQQIVGLYHRSSVHSNYFLNRNFIFSHFEKSWRFLISVFPCFAYSCL